MSLAGRRGPGPATEDAVLEAEAAIGFPIPSILRRLYLEVANGGFGPRFSVIGVRGHDYLTGGYYADIVEGYGDGPEEEEDAVWLAGKVWLLDWGCAIWSLGDFDTPEGMMWGWDPNTCSERHMFFPKDQTVKDWLADSIGTEYPRPFCNGYFGRVPVDANGCRPENWVNGRRAVQSSPQ